MARVASYDVEGFLGELFACRRWRVVHSAVRLTYLDKRAEISRNRFDSEKLADPCGVRCGRRRLAPT